MIALIYHESNANLNLGFSCDVTRSMQLLNV
jgi:hypothetical protein